MKTVTFQQVGEARFGEKIPMGTWYEADSGAIYRAEWLVTAWRNVPLFVREETVAETN